MGDYLPSFNLVIKSFKDSMSDRGVDEITMIDNHKYRYMFCADTYMCEQYLNEVSFLLNTSSAICHCKIIFFSFVKIGIYSSLECRAL